MQDFILVSLFNGLSIGQKALKDIGVIPTMVYSSEVDKYALIHEQKHYPLNIKLGDVTKIDFRKIRESHPDTPIILIGGSPCQNLSLVGNKAGLSTECNIKIETLEQYLQLKDSGFSFKGQSYLFWEFVRAKEELKPDFFLLENVKMIKGVKEVFDKTMGVKGVLYDSALVSAQNRLRYYWFNWSKPLIMDRNIKLHDVLDYSQPFRPLGEWVKSKKWGKIDKKKSKKEMLRTVNDSKAFTLTTKKTHSSQYYLNAKRDMYRNLTVEEYEALQTLPKGYTSVDKIPDGQKYKLIGNGWTLKIIELIFLELFKGKQHG